MKRHLLEAADLDRADATLVLDTAAQIDAGAGRPRGQEAADAARPHGGQPLLRGLHPHPHLLRAGRQAALGRRHQLLGEGHQRLQGREPQGHRADPRGDGQRRDRRPALRLRRAAPAGALGAGQRRQRRRRHPRAPHPGAARRLHDPAAARPARGRAGGDRRRRPAQPGRPLQRAACCTRSAPRSPSSRRRRCCRSASAAGRSRSATTSTPCCPRPTW